MANRLCCASLLLACLVAACAASCATAGIHKTDVDSICIYHDNLISATPIAMRAEWIIQRYPRSRVVISDKDSISEIMRQVQGAIDRSQRKSGIIDARVVCLLHRGENIVDTLCLSLVSFSYRGQSYDRDSALLKAVVSHLGADRQEELYEVFPEWKSEHLAIVTSGIPIKGRVIDRATGKPLKAIVWIEDIKTGVEAFQFKSDPMTGTYVAALPPGQDYGVTVSAQGYVFESARYTVPLDASYDTIRQDFRLIKLAQGVSFASRNIFFSYNTATLEPESRLELDRIVALMKEHDGMRMEIDGHTDDIGHKGYGKKISLDRAEAVRQYLISVGGISPDRLKTRGFGFSKPVASNSSEEGRRQNRRVEFTILEY